jgi:para-nitrobenzyl esterase
MASVVTDGRSLCWRGIQYGIVCAIGLFILCFGTAASAAPTVTVEQGTLTGVDMGGVAVFRGVRYAMPPVGDLRWRPPQPVARGQQQVDATNFGSDCPQGTSPWGKPSTTEDCLFLNIYVPGGTDGLSEHAGELPVMIWLHGGGFSFGNGAAYDSTPLAQGGNVIVVTINYRLGALGLFAHPALDSEDHLLANYALMDQQLAFEWVKHNIAAFGGDPANVTIFGESAGGDAVIAHLASPLAAGLFQKAIIHSGGTHYISLQDSETVGVTLAGKVGCGQGSDAEVAACLRSVPVSQLIANEATPIAAVIEGKMLPMSPAAAFAAGKFNHVPIINGTNHDEGRIVVALNYDLAEGVGPLQPGDYQSALQFFGPFLPGTGWASGDIPTITQEYPLGQYPSTDLATAQVFTDGALACPALEVDNELSRYVPVWAYEFNDVNAPVIVVPLESQKSFPYGATHFSELQFLFNMSALTIPGTPGLSPAEQELSARMIRYWTSFATFGDPNGVKPSPHWRRFNHVAGTPMQSLDTPRPRPEFDFANDHKCDFWHVLGEGA